MNNPCPQYEADVVRFIETGEVERELQFHLDEVSCERCNNYIIEIQDKQAQQLKEAMKHFVGREQDNPWDDAFRTFVIAGAVTISIMMSYSLVQVFLK